MKKKLMIVDDVEYLRRIARTDIESLGIYEIIEATNGKDAVFKARKTKPDIILMDLDMPIMNGIEAAKEIKRELPNTYIIMNANVCQEKTIINSIIAGARDFILKPYNRERLLTSLEKYETIF